MPPRPLIAVEVVYAAGPHAHRVAALRLPAGASAAAAVEASGLLRQHADIAWPGAPLGVFGRRVAPETALNDGDRVEIYRPLTLDPKERRRRRAGR